MIQDEEYGPAMRALTDRQRKFVLAMAADPFGSAAAWARAAEFSDKSQAAKVTGHRLKHDEKVQKAITELARTHLQTFGPMLATAGLLRIASDPKHKNHLRALEMLANRVGLHETTEHHVTVERTDRTGAAMVERIKELAG